MMDVLRELFESLLPVAGSMLATALTGLAVAMLKRWSIDIDAAQQERIRAVVRRAIGGAEERMTGNPYDGEPPTGREKAELATRWIQEKYPRLTADAIQAMIDQEIAFMPSLGRTKDRLTSATASKETP